MPVISAFFIIIPYISLFDSELKLLFHSRIDDSHGQEHANRHEMYEVIEKYLNSGVVVLEESPSQGCSIKWKT